MNFHFSFKKTYHADYCLTGDIHTATYTFRRFHRLGVQSTTINSIRNSNLCYCICWRVPAPWGLVRCRFACLDVGNANSYAILSLSALPECLLGSACIAKRGRLTFHLPSPRHDNKKTVIRLVFIVIGFDADRAGTRQEQSYHHLVIITLGLQCMCLGD